jgi:hypothetical protein
VLRPILKNSVKSTPKQELPSRVRPSKAALSGCSKDVPKPNLSHLKVRQYFRPMDIQAYIWYYVVMKRTALFLKEEQIEKLQKLSDKTGAPLAELIRRAIDRYLQERAKELK